MIMIMSIETTVGLGLHGLSNCFGILQASIMLIILPIMLLSSAQKCYPLC